MKVRGWRCLALALALVAGAGCGEQGPAAPASGTEGQELTAGTVYTIVGVQSGRCMNIAGGSTADLAALELRDCSGGTSQQFRLEAAADAGYYALRAVGSGKCLDVTGASTSAGAAIIQYTCHGATNQQWSTANAGNGAVRIASRSSGMSLDAYGARTANVTNMSLSACSAAAPTYREGVAYAVRQLATLSNVYIYLDMAHSAWLGWEHPDQAAAVYDEVLAAAGGASMVRGFATNVANYSALLEPFNPYDNQNQYMDLIVNFYEWNRMIDEVTYVKAMRARFPSHHFVVDTGRNGWPARAAGLPIEHRTHRGNWCNVTGAGIGERPRADPAAGVDAYYWLKPPEVRRAWDVT